MSFSFLGGYNYHGTLAIAEKNKAHFSWISEGENEKNLKIEREDYMQHIKRQILLQDIKKLCNLLVDIIKTCHG